VRVCICVIGFLTSPKRLLERRRWEPNVLKVQLNTDQPTDQPTVHLALSRR